MISSAGSKAMTWTPLRSEASLPSQRVRQLFLPGLRGVCWWLGSHPNSCLQSRWSAWPTNVAWHTSGETHQRCHRQAFTKETQPNETTCKKARTSVPRYPVSLSWLLKQMEAENEHGKTRIWETWTGIVEWLHARMEYCMIEIVPSFEGLVKSRIFVAVLNWPRCRQTWIEWHRSSQNVENLSQLTLWQVCRIPHESYKKVFCRKASVIFTDCLRSTTKKSVTVTWIWSSNMA